MKRKLWIIITVCCMSLAARAQFVTKPLNFPGTLYNVYTYAILDENHSWFGVDHVNWSTLTLYHFPYAVKTNDGGNTFLFDSIPATGTTICVQELSAIDTNLCYYVVTDGDVTFSVWKTTDGGTSWVNKSDGQFTGGFIDFIHAFSADTVTAFGDINGGYWEVQCSTDGGDTWTRTPSSNIPAGMSSEYSNWRHHAVIGNTVWFATSRGRCYKSENRGLNWTVTPVISVNGIECDVKFSSPLNGVFFKASVGGGTKITTDGGTTWSAVTIPGNRPIISASPVDGWPAGFVYTMSTSTANVVDVYFTPDLFSTNIPIGQGISSSGLLSFKNTTTGWLSGAGTATDNLYSFNGVLTSLKEAATNSSTLSIVPNPSCNSALVTLPAETSRKQGVLSVFDLAGNLVYWMPADTRGKWMSLDAGNFRNGCYIVTYRDEKGNVCSQRWIVCHD